MSEMQERRKREAWRMALTFFSSNTRENSAIS